MMHNGRRSCSALWCVIGSRSFKLRTIFRVACTTSSGAISLKCTGAGREDERRYTIENSLFVFAEYFGCVEALRREVQFLDFGVDEENRKTRACLEGIASAFLRDDVEREFRVFRGRQRAIGEVMLMPRGSGGGSECIGMATFTSDWPILSSAAGCGHFRTILNDSPSAPCSR